jgi:putative hydrolase of the HAD superfamily
LLAQGDKMGVLQGDSTIRQAEALVFDLDDTLFDKTLWLIPAIELAARKMDYDYVRVAELAHAYVAERGCADAGIYNAVLEGCGQSDSAINIRAFAAWVNQYEPDEGCIPLYPGALEALIDLQRHYRLGIIADGPASSQRAKIKGLGLEPLLASVVFSDEIEGIRSRKPDARPYRKAIAELRCRPEQAIFIGDNPVKDFIRARSLGLHTVRVLTGEYAKMDYPSREHAADYQISSVARLPQLLANPPAPRAYVSAPPLPRDPGQQRVHRS